MEAQTKILKVIITLVAIPLGIILLQGLLAPLLLLASDTPDFFTYVLSGAVIGGWLGLVGLLRTAYTLGTCKVPNTQFVAFTFLSGAIGLVLAVYAFWFSGFITGLSLALLILAVYTVYLWYKFKKC